MHTRQNALNEWLKIQFGHEEFTLALLAGDASFRRYFRLQNHAKKYIVVDAPPPQETLRPFAQVNDTLQKNGIKAPQIHSIEYEQGFALLEDFGDLLFLQALAKQNPQMLYPAAMQTLVQIQQCPSSDLPVFDASLMQNELALFENWFLANYLKLELTQNEKTLIQETFTWLIDAILEQPQVFVHRDYHSRNIMVLSEERLGIIDFQDAVHGPFTYDLVSLLKDCYIQWPPHQLNEWLTYFFENCQINHNYSFNQFKRAFEICGLQRHLKVLGIFCRLYLRDNKANYLQDLPLTFDYVKAALEGINELEPFYQFMLKKVQPKFLEKNKQ